MEDVVALGLGEGYDTGVGIWLAPSDCQVRRATCSRTGLDDDALGFADERNIVGSITCPRAAEHTSQLLRPRVEDVSGTTPVQSTEKAPMRQVRSPPSVYESHPFLLSEEKGLQPYRSRETTIPRAT